MDKLYINCYSSLYFCCVMPRVYMLRRRMVAALTRFEFTNGSSTTMSMCAL